MMRFRCASVGWFWFFSHFSMAESLIPSPSKLVWLVHERRNWRRDKGI
jgi:hypothetical protein